MVWWRLLRPFTLMASVIPVLAGGMLAVTEGTYHLGRLFAFLVAAAMIQSATNMFNEYFDYVRGLDTKEHVGIAGTIVRDGVAPRTVLLLAWAFIGTAVAIGVYISAVTSWWVFVTGLACIGVAYLYSGGPFPLSYTPFGELAAGFTMGPVIVLLVYFTQTLTLKPAVFWVSLPIGLLIAGILMANNIRDREADVKGGRKTLAILLGRRRTTFLLGGLFGLSYVLNLALVLGGYLSPWTLLVLLSVPSAHRVIRLFLTETEPARLHPAVKGTSQLLAKFGVLMSAGMLVSVLL